MAKQLNFFPLIVHSMWTLLKAIIFLPWSAILLCQYDSHALVCQLWNNVVCNFHICSVGRKTSGPQTGTELKFCSCVVETLLLTAVWPHIPVHLVVAKQLNAEMATLPISARNQQWSVVLMFEDFLNGCQYLFKISDHLLSVEPYGKRDCYCPVSIILLWG